MMTFSYRISLQVRHPDADPDAIAEGLALRPHRQWKAGQQRSTPKGNELSGRYRETYCVFDLAQGDDGELADKLRSCVDSLLATRSFLAHLRETGGTMNFYISWTVGERGEVFKTDLLSDIADLGIDLGIEPLCES